MLNPFSNQSWSDFCGWISWVAALLVEHAQAIEILQMTACLHPPQVFVVLLQGPVGDRGDRGEPGDTGYPVSLIPNA